MNDRNIQNSKSYLQKEDVQERIRQDTPDVLDKLAIIKELIEEGGYALGSIPPDIDRIWDSISREQEDHTLRDRGNEVDSLPINLRIENVRAELFWRYYASRALRLSLMLVCDELPNSPAGLVLPLQPGPIGYIDSVKDLAKLGPSLIGWLSKTRSSHTLFTLAPSFQYNTDYSLLPLAVMKDDRPLEQPEDKTFIVLERLDRRSNKTLTLTLEEVETIRLPKDPSLPLQQHTLVVRAQSQHSPHKIGGTTVSPDKFVNALSLRAYQSGDVIYRPNVTDTDSSIALHQVEGPIRSALAVPIGWESGSVVAVLYVVSYEIDAFSNSLQRLLRMVCRMIEEAILTYRVRQQATARLTNALDHSGSVDHLFEGFLSENDFVRDIEGLLTALKTQLGEWKEPRHEIVPLEVRKARYREQQTTGEVVSFIAVDLDNQSSLAVKYGDQVARNLSKEVGTRIRGQQLFSTNPEHRRLYHICADRFYLLLKGIALDEARNKAEQLRVALNGNYRIEARRVSTERLMLPEGKLELPSVTVRLGVAAYPYRKLEELLQRYPAETAVADVRAQIMRDLGEILNLGQQEGGNVIISWDIDSWGYIHLNPNK